MDIPKRSTSGNTRAVTRNSLISVETNLTLIAEHLGHGGWVHSGEDAVARSKHIPRSDRRLPVLASVLLGRGGRLSALAPGVQE